VIGYAFSITGTRTVDVARDQIASWPGGRQPSIRIAYDSVAQGDTPDLEVQRAVRLAQLPGIVTVVGHGGSRGSLAAAPVYNEARLPQIVPTSTSRLLRKAGPWTFMLPPNDSVEGAFMGAFALEVLHARRVSILYFNDEYGAGLRDGIVGALAGRAARVLDQASFDLTSDLPTIVAASMHRGVPDVLFVAGRQRQTGTIARLARGHAPGVRILAGDGALVLPTLADSAGAAAESLYVVAFWLPDSPDSLSRAFVERFRRVAGHDPLSTDAMTHDALMLAATAIRAVGADRGAVRGYLESLGRSRPPFPGITGPITFLPDRPARLVMARLQRGMPLRVNPP
jgi:branched-chain amino acid transport system substrate-binding protein